MEGTLMRINGSDVAALDGRVLSVHNPATGEQIASIPRSSSDDVRRAVDAAEQAFPVWKGKTMRERGKILFMAAQSARRQVNPIARLLTREQGKPIREATDEILGFCNVLEYYAALSAHSQEQFIDLGKGAGAVVREEPLGTCGAIIPWNMPAIIMAWKTAPALLAGNTVVIKPSATASLAVLFLGKILEEAGLPPGTLNIITGSGAEAGDALVRERRLQALSFTGSSATGKNVRALVSDRMVPLTLELGGSDPMVVLPDADLDGAVKGAVHGRFYNAGQICTAVKRLYVHEKISDEFLPRLKEAVSAIRFGNGLDPDVRMGPLNNREGYDHIRSLIKTVLDRKEGLVLTGGIHGDLEPAGNYYPPTLVTGLPPESCLLTEEVFGPVLPVVTIPDLDTAIRWANHSPYGLGASVWTHDTRAIQEFFSRIHAGIVWVNRHISVPPEIPFGGTGSSGTGRENGKYALLHYTRSKTLYYNP